MVQHDEALSDFKSVINMFDGSLQFIKDNFDVLPKVAIAIDSFGHSSITPYIYDALGFEAIVIYRMPSELYIGLNNQKKFFFSWEGDNQKELKVYRLLYYSLDWDAFFLDKSRFSGDACFRETNDCAEKFIDLHMKNQIFQLNETHKMAFQTFGTDFSFQQGSMAF